MKILAERGKVDSVSVAVSRHKMDFLSAVTSDSKSRSHAALDRQLCARVPVFALLMTGSKIP